MNILGISISSGILIIIVIIIRSCTLYRMPKFLFLSLWAVVGLHLLISAAVFLGFVINIDNWLLAEISGLRIEWTQANNFVLCNLSNQASWYYPSLQAGTPLFTGVIIWALGVAVMGIIVFISYYRSSLRIKMALPVNAGSGTLLKNRRPVRMYVSDMIATPVTCGIIKPKIIFPKSMDFNDSRLVNYVISHEMQHIRHFDSLWKIILLIILCLYWFNPIVWFMYITANRDLELACDEKVLRSCGENAKAAYALSLIGMAERINGLVPLYSGFCTNAAEERIMSVMKYKKTEAAARVTAFVLIIAVSLFSLYVETGFGSFTNETGVTYTITYYEEPDIVSVD